MFLSYVKGNDPVDFDIAESDLWRKIIYQIEDNEIIYIAMINIPIYAPSRNISTFLILCYSLLAVLLTQSSRWLKSRTKSLKTFELRGLLLIH